MTNVEQVTNINLASAKSTLSVSSKECLMPDSSLVYPYSLSKALMNAGCRVPTFGNSLIASLRVAFSDPVMILQCASIAEIDSYTE